MPTKRCERCGVIFTSAPSMIERRRYCSRACYRPSIETRMAERIVRQPNGCWEFTGFLDSDGYGMITVREGDRFQSRRAHRVSWAIHRGKIPKGKWVLHKCDNPKCVNPAHLFLGTGADNNRDMLQKGRSRPARGEQVGGAKLTEQKVREIRQLWAAGETQRALGVKFKIGFKAINKIVHNQRWKHVT